MIAIAQEILDRGRPFLFGLILAATYPDTEARSAEAEDPWQTCVREIARAERAQGLPRHLLVAVANVESGRWRADSGETIAWPWTVTAEGRGRFLPSKAAAIAVVRRLRARGLRNIDVGCMQVNLRYHGHAFENLESALDPTQNVAYAARFLRRLRATGGSWTRAVGNYHSNTPRLSGPYRAKVLRAYSEARHRAQRARRAARLAAAADTRGELP